MALPYAFPTRLPTPGLTYAPGTIIPWYAADNVRELKWAKENPPEGFELMGWPKVTLKPNGKKYPHFMNSTNHRIYVLYVRKV